MGAPAFDATRIVRPILLTIALYLSIIVLSSVTMAKAANASGQIQPSSATVSPVKIYWWMDNNTGLHGPAAGSGAAQL